MLFCSPPCCLHWKGQCPAFKQMLYNWCIFFFIHCKLTFAECFAARQIGFCTAAVACRHSAVCSAGGRYCIMCDGWKAPAELRRNFPLLEKSPWEFLTSEFLSSWWFRFELISFELMGVCQLIGCFYSFSQNFSEGDYFSLRCALHTQWPLQLVHIVSAGHNQTRQPHTVTAEALVCCTATAHRPKTSSKMKMVENLLNKSK